MEREAPTNILFLDACRNNPLARNLAGAMGTRSAVIGRGLAAVESGAGTLISFSTQPGNVALDGAGRNSPFAGALVKHLSSSQDDLGSILIAVRNDVMEKTERKQVPWEHSAMTRRFYFKDVALRVPVGDGKFDGNWLVRRLGRASAGCAGRPELNFQIHLESGKVSGRFEPKEISDLPGKSRPPIIGSISANGEINFNHHKVDNAGKISDESAYYKGTFRGNSASGTYSAGQCNGTFTVTRT